MEYREYCRSTGSIVGVQGVLQGVLEVASGSMGVRGIQRNPGISK